MRLRLWFVIQIRIDIKKQDKSRVEFNTTILLICIYNIGESTCGQRALYEIGMTGIPIYNCNSNCSTGANALILAKQLIETGQNDCILAVGFEKMEPGSLGAKVRILIL